MPNIISDKNITYYSAKQFLSQALKRRLFAFTVEVRKKTGAPSHSAQLRRAKAWQEHKQAVPQDGAPTLVHLLSK